MAWPPTGSPTHDDIVTTWLPNSVGDRILYVSKSGSDSNNGRSWATAYLTIGKALTTLGTSPGTVFIGAGDYTESPALTDFQALVGVGENRTNIILGATGTLIDLNTKLRVGLYNLTLKFASASVTGTLLKLTNSFQCTTQNVTITGTSTASQVGMWLLSNAGDSNFINTWFNNLDVGVQNDTTVNYWSNCTFGACVTASFRGGDSTGALYASGAAISDSTFVGVPAAGSCYLKIAGSADTYTLTGVWFDGGADDAIICGASGTAFGPRLLSIIGCTSLTGKLRSLVLHAADRVLLDGVRFGDTGSHPVEITIPTPANVKRGRITACNSTQGTHQMETYVPVTWEGWRGYIYADSGQVLGMEVSEYQDSSPNPLTYRRVVIRITNRQSGAAQTVLTFPSAFETSWGGGSIFKTFDNTGMVPVVTATTCTLPANAVCNNGMIIIEGY